MVRAGDWEMRLVRSGSHEPFPEVRQQGGAGTTYAVASPGQEFEVQLIQHSNPDLAAIADRNTLRKARLEIDGQDVRYGKIYNSYAALIHTFQGFLKAGDVHGCAFQGFVFSKPQETEAKEAHSLVFTEGTIKATVWPAERTGELRTTRHHGPAATNESVAKLPEGKKFFNAPFHCRLASLQFFMAPSLTTGKGELKTGGGFGRYRHRTMGPPVAVLELRYETAATLLLRGVLRPDNPAHAAILARFEGTAAEGQDGRGAAGPSHRRAAPAAAAEVKLEDGGVRKRQRRQQQQEGEPIDLTRVPNANDQVLAAKQANQVLECDLTAADEPAWRTIAKEVHQVV